MEGEVKIVDTEEVPPNILLDAAVETMALPELGLVKVATLLTLVPLASFCHTWLLSPEEEPVTPKPVVPLKLSTSMLVVPEAKAAPVKERSLPKHKVEEAGVTEIPVGLPFTTWVFEAVGDPHTPAFAVNVKVAVPLKLAGAVHVGFNEAASENVPPIPPSDHVALTEEPPMEPPNAAEVPPWQIAERAEPALTIAVGLTDTVFDAKAAVHGLPPVVVSIKVAVPVNEDGGVHVAFNEFALGLKEPPEDVDQVPPVAEPSTEPPNGAVVPPWQISLRKDPAFAEGGSFTTRFFEAVADPHAPPEEVSVKTAVPV